MKVDLLIIVKMKSVNYFIYDINSSEIKLINTHRVDRLDYGVDNNFDKVNFEKLANDYSIRKVLVTIKSVVFNKDEIKRSLPSDRNLISSLKEHFKNIYLFKYTDLLCNTINGENEGNKIVFDWNHNSTASLIMGDKLYKSSFLDELEVDEIVIDGSKFGDIASFKIVKDLIFFLTGEQISSINDIREFSGTYRDGVHIDSIVNYEGRKYWRTIFSHMVNFCIVFGADEFYIPEELWEGNGFSELRLKAIFQTNKMPILNLNKIKIGYIEEDPLLISKEIIKMKNKYSLKI